MEKKKRKGIADKDNNANGTLNLTLKYIWTVYFLQF